MTRRSIRAAALALTVAASLAPVAQAQVTGPMPFNAVLRFSETVSFTGAAPCFAIGMLSGSGMATVVGRLTATSQDCINPLGVFDPNGPNAFQFVSGTGPQGLVFTALNGDRLFATYAGTLMPRAGAPHLLTGHFVIAGGTGRFRSAAGGGTLSGSESIGATNGVGEVSLTGRLSF
jgi:hypothetical protein